MQSLEGENKVLGLNVMEEEEGLVKGRRREAM